MKQECWLKSMTFSSHDYTFMHNSISSHLMHTIIIIPAIVVICNFFSDNKTFKGNFTVMTKDVTVWHFLIALQFPDTWMFWWFKKWMLIYWKSDIF